MAVQDAAAAAVQLDAGRLGRGVAAAQRHLKVVGRRGHLLGLFVSFLSVPLGARSFSRIALPGWRGVSFTAGDAKTHTHTHTHR